MKALVYHTAGTGAGSIAWEDKPLPTLQHPNDAIVRITTTTICGTDLHILKGDMPAVTDGRILGHEGIGIIEQIGEDVEEFKVGGQGHHLLRHLLHQVRLLPPQHALALPPRRLDPRLHHRRKLRPSTSASRTPTAASTTSPKVAMKRRWSC